MPLYEPALSSSPIGLMDFFVMVFNVQLQSRIERGEAKLPLVTKAHRRGGLFRFRRFSGALFGETCAGIH